MIDEIMLSQTKEAAQEEHSSNTEKKTEPTDSVSFTRYTKKNGNLTKKISLTESGKVIKDSSDCWLADGTAERITISFERLPEFLGNIEQNQAVGWGVNSATVTNIVSQKKIGRSVGCQTRTKENFSYPLGKRGVILLDSDSGEDPYYIITAIGAFFPELLHAAKVIKPSVSAFLFRKSTGEELSGKNNAHIYLYALDAADIPRFGKVLHKRLILSGHARVEFSRDGKVLIRTLVDQFVYSPERLDFAALAILVGDLEQRLPEIRYIPGGSLDTSKLQELSNIEEIQYEKILRDLKRGAAKEAGAIREKYEVEEGRKVAEKLCISYSAAQKIIHNRLKGILSGDELLQFDDGRTPSVREAIRNSADYDGATMPDHAEPEYGGGRNKAIFYANLDTGFPLIHSLAHGGRVYILRKDFDDLKAQFQTKGEDLRDWAKHVADADVTNEQSEELVNIVHELTDISLKTLRKSLKDALNQKDNQIDESEYKTPEFAHLNLAYGCVLAGGKTVIIEECYDEDSGSWVAKLHNPRELGVYLQNQRIPSGNDSIPIFPLWMDYPLRNTFDNIVFKPDPTIFRSGPRIIQQGGTYNIWQGYTKTPIQGDCSLILDHIREVWCSNYLDMYDYVLNWLAYMFQHPDRQGETALVLRSGQGTGKNIIAEAIARLFGIHALIATRKDDFLGRFNSILGQAVFVYVNEAVWAGDKEKQGTLKALITDRFLTIEKKYLDSFKFRNCTHLLFASNESYVAPADIGDRRFVYPKVSDHRVGDKEYFKALVNQIDGEGLSAFLYEMLNRDIDGLDLSKFPENQSDQRTTDQMMTMPIHLKFMHHLLDDEFFEMFLSDHTFFDPPDFLKPAPWQEQRWTISKETFHRMYVFFCHKMKYQHPEIKDVLIRKIVGDIPGMISMTKPTINKKRVNCLEFPPLSKARELFVSRTKIALKWED